ncbi:hypothetical protein [Heyndrickxia ginsengihumi]|uniref:hypothetical protein n=1 Tax=Heyndrickxia ginsengihumi TaxID=363870 RepID=UPI003D25367A
MTLDEIKPFLDKNVLVILDTGQQYKGYLTNYVPELDDDENLIQSVDLIPSDGHELGYYYGFELEQIKKIELI